MEGDTDRVIPLDGAAIRAGGDVDGTVKECSAHRQWQLREEGVTRRAIQTVQTRHDLGGALVGRQFTLLELENGFLTEGLDDVVG